MTTARVETRYRLLPYERRFLSDELKVLGATEVGTLSDRVFLATNLLPDQAVRITYAHRIAYDRAAPVYTHQGSREGCQLSGRQNTRYGPHGLHDYKGKFHPQTPRSLILQHRWSSDRPILDPFAGTGTTLIEARGLLHPAEGVEFNPLAALVARAKLAWEYAPTSKPLSEESLTTASPLEWPDEAGSYLRKWFPGAVLISIQRALGAIEKLPPNDNLVAKVLLSNVLRRYSWQDPRDLRIRRRSTIPAGPLLLRLLAELISREWDRRNRWVRQGHSHVDVPARVWCGDSRNLPQVRGKGMIAGTITSPPYACALPYVDTYRLSIVTLGLAKPSVIGHLEYDTIGGRDTAQADRELFDKRVNLLPTFSREFVTHLHKLVEEDQRAGFRRRAVPLALARYLTDLLGVLRELRRLERADAPNLWVVGPNSTTLSNVKRVIPTPELIGDLCKSVGFEKVEHGALDAYSRFGIHSKNAIRTESLVSFYG